MKEVVGMGALRDPGAPSCAPTDLFDRRRLYRLRTDAKFSLPLGNATSPAAVPVRPLRLETEASTSLIRSSSMPALVNRPLVAFPVAGDSPFGSGRPDLPARVDGI